MSDNLQIDRLTVVEELYGRNVAQLVRKRMDDTEQTDTITVFKELYGRVATELVQRRIDIKEREEDILVRSLGRSEARRVRERISKARARGQVLVVNSLEELTEKERKILSDRNNGRVGTHIIPYKCICGYVRLHPGSETQQNN